MAKQRSFDLVTVIGVAVALALLFGGQLWTRSRHPELNNPPQTPPPQTQTQTQTGNPAIAPADPKMAAPQPAPADPKVGDVKRGDKTGDPAPPPPPPPVAEAEEPEPADAGDISVPNDNLKLVFSARGATLSSAVLTTEYIDPSRKKEAGQGLELLTEIERGKRAFGVPLFEIGPPEPGRENDRAKFSGASGPRRSLDDRVWTRVSSTGDFAADPTPSASGAGALNWKIVYSTTLDKKFTVTKTFTIPKTGSNVLLDLAVENPAAPPVSFSYSLNGPMGVLLDSLKDEPKNPYAQLLGEMAGRDDADAYPQIKTVDPATAAKGVEENITFSKPDNVWASVKNRFYIGMLVSLQAKQVIRFSAVPVVYGGTDTTDKRVAEPNVGVAAFRYISPVLDAQNKTLVDRYAMYLGPNDEDRLQKAEDELKLAKPVYLREVVQYCVLPGGRWPRVDWVARKMMLVFQGLHRLFGSYGLAVILLTLFIKIVMHPVQRKMLISMDKMAKLKPELDKITAKYKDQTSKEAAQKMRMEQYDLQMKAGANPVAGCLPMLITIPIFSALYGIFSHCFDMRGAEFLWIKDLSQPDRLAPLPFWPHVLNLLPIVYMVLTFLQTKINPQPPTSDPAQEQQRKMMMFMPLVFSFIFYGMPAGLVLYFAANALFGMAETWYIKKHIIKNPGPAGATAPQAGGAVAAKPARS